MKVFHHIFAVFKTEFTHKIISKHKYLHRLRSRFLKVFCAVFMSLLDRANSTDHSSGLPVLQISDFQILVFLCACFELTKK